MIVDECFPGETLIQTSAGNKRIDKIKDGELIYNATGEGTVRSVFSKTVYETISVRLSNGTVFECTKDHPIFTHLGWRPAGSLERGQKLFCREELRALWAGDEAVNHQLHSRRGYAGGGDAFSEEAFLRELLRKEIEQPDAQGGVEAENASNVKAYRSQAESARRQREGFDSYRKNDAQQTSVRLDSMLCVENTEKAGARLSAPLQAGFGPTNNEAMFGIGRGESWSSESAGSRSKERRIIERAWVESLQTNKYPGGKIVFNLRVSGHPSYFANGILVHNCHAKRAQTIEFIKNNPEIKVIGLSATPFTKGLGDTYTNVVSTVTTKQLVDQKVLAPLRVFIAKEIDMTGAKKLNTGEWTGKETEKRGMQITGDIVSEWIKKTHEIFGKPVKTIVFCAGVAHGADLAKKFAEEGYNFVSISYKDDGTFKQDVIEDFSRPDTEIHGLIATDILTKGFDVPDVMIGVSARPFSKSLSSHIQQMGRVMRSHPGKEYGVWLDHSGNYIRFQEDWEEVYNNGVSELDDTREKPKKEKTDKEKEAAKCPMCGSFWPAQSDTCLNCGHVRERKNAVQEVAGEMEELAPSASRDAKQDWWGMCQYMVQLRGWSPGRAAHTYKEKFGVWPRGLADTPVLPSKEFDKAVKAALIRFLKSKK